MKVIYLIKEDIHIYPPCLTQILNLKENGIDIIVYHGRTSKQIISIFDKFCIEHHELYEREIRSKNKNILKIKKWLIYRKKAKKVLKKFKKEIIWFGTADSAIAVFDKLKGTKYVLSILELYDNNKFYRTFLGKIVKSAYAIISCEYNRANIMKSWWDLKQIPYVIPNKTCEDILETKFDIDEEIIKELKRHKNILYQGIISKDRNLILLAEALKELNSDYYLVVMGKNIDNSIEKVKSIYDKVIYLGYIPAPNHMLYTKYAYIGIANYDYSSLNNVFCAPNKIYEYSKFSIPILGSDVPGLKYTIGNSNAGVCVNFDNIEQIKKGITKIETNYEEFKVNSKKFYDALNIPEIYERIVKELIERYDNNNN